MIEKEKELTVFLVRAKRATYAAGMQPVTPSRMASHDLPYSEGPWYYLDTYLGGLKFIGEEAVWYESRPVWGMNYYGYILVETMPEGLPQFLKAALLHIPAEAPYRGPVEFSAGSLVYRCQWEGQLRCFWGNEWIEREGQKVYELRFHGGEVL